MISDIDNQMVSTQDWVPDMYLCIEFVLQFSALQCLKPNILLCSEQQSNIWHDTVWQECKLFWLVVIMLITDHYVHYPLSTVSTSRNGN